MVLRVLELFSGLGGFHEALGGKIIIKNIYLCVED
jgi:hypothetical protein